MEFKLPSSFMKILADCRAEAIRLQRKSVDACCLLLGLLKDNNSAQAQLLSHIGTDIAAVMKEAEDKLATKPVDPIVDEKDCSMIMFGEDSTRLFRLALLEARMSGMEADGRHMLLAILHDQSNDARHILEHHGLNYNQVIEETRQGTTRSAYTSPAPDEPESPLPGRNNQRQAQADSPTPESDTPILDNYGSDLTQLAADGQLDPVVGRNDEMQRVAQILCRRRKNNPLLIGQAGVGKTAVVEGLAQRIVERRVPRLLLGKRIIAMQLANLVAGTQFRGQFEERLRKLIQEIKSHKEIILYIDEIHSIIGAGGVEGGLDAANILKPALARGDIQCIGATTIDEYKKSIEKDRALERRFQHLIVEPTDKADTLTILQHICKRYEDHHHVRYTDKALAACVALTERYVTDRVFPDKAIDALDEAGSRKSLVAQNTPKEILNLEEAISQKEKEKSQAAKSENYTLAAELRDQIKAMNEQLLQATEAWQRSNESEAQVVDEEDIAHVVSLISGVPVQRMTETETHRLRELRNRLAQKVVAQSDAIDKLSRSIVRNRIGIANPNRPIGTFLFVGPTGVGKTYLVKCLAEEMFGSADALIRFDMSEYGERHTVSRLVGAPPGYVGYEEGGQLTEKVKRHPYSVLLLDEIEKAHPDIFNTLLQVLDEGRLTDGNGNTVDFRHTIIVMTSNSGSRELKDFGRNVGFNATDAEAVSAEKSEKIIQKALKRQFAPEFLNRLDEVIFFNPLTADDAKDIARLQVEQFRERLSQLNIRVTFGKQVCDFIAAKGFDVQYGARSIARTIQTYLENEISAFLIENDLVDRSTPLHLTVSCREDQIKVKKNAKKVAKSEEND
ncbi:MAG: ATP-dependent Clp protease ATP-binding subunit [Alloprevotella sp.]|nr:ATP-dependent Clp protease ATP-binding subunit [Alloprevotella sp.]